MGEVLVIFGMVIIKTYLVRLVYFVVLVRYKNLVVFEVVHCHFKN